ncbi:MAG: NAD kinase [Prevotellaceae bacterium]|nr:NAD kinase [Prevotella sp.]MDD7257993.1 NAD kinase [Prevotellaceae bacterium]MDY6131715.1 NAD kinase [Prevotella sp.]
MVQGKLRFALFGNVYQAKKSANIQSLLSGLASRNAEIYIESEFYEFLTQKQHLEVNATGVFHDKDFEADYVISLGGDGTLLKAASHVCHKETPIMGINMGRLGFLADIKPQEIEKALDALYKGDFTITEHATIEVEAEGNSFGACHCALNEIAVLKRDNASMISIQTHIDGELLGNYQADGLIVSTPTGSTAYSLSNGGPIIVPRANVLCLTPVAPHSLNIRPIVVADDSEITLNVKSRSHHFLVALDGRSIKCKEGTRITIRKSPFKIKIVKRYNTHYFTTLREKLMWGADKRS